MPKESRKPLYVKLALVLALVAACVAMFAHRGLRLGLDLSGGVELLYRIRTETLTPTERHNITERTIEVIRRRVDPRGTEQLDIRPRGQHRFYIQIPHREEGDAERIERRLQRAGNLLFCLVEDREEYRRDARRGEPVPQHTVFIRRPDEPDAAERGRYLRGTFRELADLLERRVIGDDDWMLVRNTPVTTGQYLSRVYPTRDENQQNAVGFELRGRGASAFAEATGAHTGHRLAIILDNILYSAPQIRSRITGSGIITGRFTEAEMTDLITTLQAGSLPADIELEWKHVVGPGLGQDSITQGRNAIVIGLILVLIFMAIYYMLAGLIANLAVILNLVIIVGVMSALGVVLTLPGLAGLVLTVGIAVDANVLIYERIREELKRGKGLRLAIRAGYERAFITIVDSNLTTLITALILFGIGTGPVRGFAVTLSVGILASMFTSLVVTRLIFETLLEHNVIHRLPMLQMLKEPSVSFSKVRRIALGASLILIAIGLVVFNVRGAEKYDTDLTGGFSADIELAEGMQTAEVRRRISERFVGADVQHLQQAEGERGRLPRRFLVRIKDMSDRLDIQTEKLRSDFARAIAGSPYANGEAVTVLDSLTLDVQLGTPVDEGVLRALLEEQDYRRADITRLTAQNAASDRFTFYLRLGRAYEGEPDGAVGSVLAGLGDLVERREIRVERVGSPEGVAPSPGDPRTREIEYQLDFTLQDPAPEAAIREAVYEQFLGGARPRLEVLSADDDLRSTEEMRHVRLRGDVPTLEAILAGLRDAMRLEVASFSQPQANELRVTLRSAQSEDAIQQRFELADADGLMNKEVVQAILPRGVEDDHYVAVMAPLREGKMLEKVSEDMLDIFADVLAAQRFEAQIEETEAPVFVDDREVEAYSFFTLKLDRPMQIQQIAAHLTRAGYPNALVLEEEMRLVALDETDEVVIRIADDPAEIATAKDDIRATFATPNPFHRLESIGAAVAGEMRNKAILAMIVALIAIVFYIWLRFGEIKFGIAAIAALTHDVLMVMGAIAVADALSGTAVGSLLGFSDIKINVEMIAAFLTIVGYSLNDTIVVFDRIRENVGGKRRKVDANVVDRSVNQCLSRTVLTSLTTLIVVLVLYLIGGVVIHGFAFALIVGVLFGTYSSIFVASPILVDWEAITGFLKKLFRVATFRFS